MDHSELHRLLRQKPFQPFRVVLSDGEAYEIRYPYMNLLAETFIKIGIPVEGDTRPRPSCDHTEFVWLKDIVRIDLLPSTPPVAS
jgi:hypothetical protein